MSLGMTPHSVCHFKLPCLGAIQTQFRDSRKARAKNTVGVGWALLVLIDSWNFFDASHNIQAQ